MTRYLQLIEALDIRIKAQAGDIQSLADALAREDQYLARKGQADLLAALRARITREVEWTRLAEERACSAFESRKKRKAAAHRIVGTGFAIFSNNDRAFQRSLDLAKAELSRTAPFGTVAIQIAPPGVPDGVTIVCVSRLAQQSWTSEQDIRIRLIARGWRLTEPAYFTEVLNRMEQDVLQGTIVLPMSCEQLGVYMASHAPEAKGVCLRFRRILAPAARPMLLPPPGRTTLGSANESTPTG